VKTKQIQDRFFQLFSFTKACFWCNLVSLILMYRN
jgi:hypothetical protein